MAIADKTFTFALLKNETQLLVGLVAPQLEPLQTYYLFIITQNGINLAKVLFDRIEGCRRGAITAALWCHLNPLVKGGDGIGELVDVMWEHFIAC